MTVLIGAIADDFTGATDLAGFLVKAGLRTVQLIGIPETVTDIADTDALVVALKTRTAETSAAVNESLRALDYLRHYGCRQFYFKYCSTFDSTEQGNIGPVADALLQALDAPFTVVCPALPVNGRTVYNGHLFVNGRLLNESGMQNHPLTPMTDPDLVRFLGKQTGGRVGLVPMSVVSQGPGAIGEILKQLETQCRYAICDAICDDDLLAIGAACKDLKLVTGGSGLAPGIAVHLRTAGLLTGTSPPDELQQIDGDCLIISGSCSPATRAQVASYRERYPALKIDPARVSSKEQTSATILRWIEDNRAAGPVLLYATDEPGRVRQHQEQLGVAQAGQLIESLFADIARSALQRGVRKFVVAGGETSGSVVQALGVTAIKIGPSIAPGVPLTQSLSDDPVLLALKSGNFGDEHFFHQAVEMMR